MEPVRRIRATAFLALTLISLLVACGDDPDASLTEPAGERLRVVTTVAPITSIAAAISGGLAGVAGLVPEGTNSHTFEPPPSAAKLLAGADVVFVNGLDLEEPTKDLAAANLAKGAEIVELGNLTVGPDDYLYDFSFPLDGGKPNPHLWTNPPMARAYGRVITETLVRRDPTNAAAYTANFDRFAAGADALDSAIRSATATLAPDRRKLLTYHDAYAYFAREYGWTVVGAIQPSDFDEPTPRDVARLIRQVRDEGVPAVFGSEVFPSPVLEQIGREAAVAYVDVLRDDDLPGRPGDPEHSWLGLMRFDFVTMVEALGGDASALHAVAVPAPGTPPDTAEYPQ